MATGREQVKQLFEAALILPDEHRNAFLGALDPYLREDVESLLASHQEDRFLEEPPSEESTAVTREREGESESADTRQIGPYRILQEIGHGGMGVVYEAEQEKPVHRKVALKLIKWGMDTKAVIARFESERQALALMNHPSIASVYDAGSTKQGRPYFAMEYVQGIPITEYCDKHRLRIKDRLELFIAVCEGVQHAHQKGIIHRDLKPSNVLVAIQDDKLVPKIIDFGVAKATAHRLTERTVYTELGQLIGTPEYMSPEQAEMTGLDIDTRTDVYSLGVILYELLVGAQPFDATELRKAGFDGIRRIIREKEPLRPSTKVHSLAKTTTDSAKNRRVEPQVWEKELRGDLDWITVKALEKDRIRLYGSPAELAADIRRHLKHEPVLASPPSTVYRLGKFIRRHRVGVAASTLVLLALLFGITGTTMGLVRSMRAERVAIQEAAKAKAINTFLQDTLSSPNPYLGMGRDVSVLEALDNAVEKIHESFSDQPEIEAEVRRNLGLTYLRLSRYEEAESLLGKALEIERQFLGPEHPNTAITLTSLGLLNVERGTLDEAESLLEEALPIARRAGMDYGDILMNLSGVAEVRGELDRAESMLWETVELWKGGGEVTEAWPLSALCRVVGLKKNYEEAETLCRDALARRREIYGNEHALVAGSIHSLGAVISHQPENSLAAMGDGDCETALPLFREAIEINKKVLDPASPKTAEVRRSHGTCLIWLGRYDEAEPELLSSYDSLRAALGMDHAETFYAVSRLVELYEAWGKPEKAAEYRAMLKETEEPK